MNPRILFLDEPEDSLIEKRQSWLLNFLEQSIEEKKVLILATHQKELSAALADQAIT